VVNPILPLEGDATTASATAATAAPTTATASTTAATVGEGGIAAASASSGGGASVAPLGSGGTAQVSGGGSHLGAAPIVTSAPAADSPESLPALELLKFWWKQASQEERARFRGWIEE
jgi:uncharacterized protein YccT (UPF0319 family)